MCWFPVNSGVLFSRVTKQATSLKILAILHVILFLVIIFSVRFRPPSHCSPIAKERTLGTRLLRYRDFCGHVAKYRNSCGCMGMSSMAYRFIILRRLKHMGSTPFC